MFLINPCYIHTNPQWGMSKNYDNEQIRKINIINKIDKYKIILFYQDLNGMENLYRQLTYFKKKSHMQGL